MKKNSRKHMLHIATLILGFGLLFQPAHAGDSSSIKKYKAKINEQQDKIDLLTMKLKNCRGNSSGEPMQYEQIQGHSLMQQREVPKQYGPEELFHYP
ncbi:MAG: hypothetical protein HQL46_12840 [Gammaproteobacteria bacterium]|nr:hypothetical protein [Gammaproteobacteria bacterium]